jgi:hypothetical protein
LIKPPRAEVTMKRVLLQLAVNVDVIVAVVLAVVILLLDFTGVASGNVVRNATMATLAVVAIVLLRDRLRGDDQSVMVRVAMERTQERLDALTSEFQRDRETRVLQGHELSRLLEEARRDTDRWVFRGATGTYVRVVTLPDCIRLARPKRRRLRFQMEILDPADPELCAEFVGLHRRMAASAASSERGWTVEGTQRELLATILAACWHQQRYELLDIEVRLSKVYSLLRYELSSAYAIFTQRGPEFPAIVVASGTAGYECWESELHVSFQQARPLPLAEVKSLPLGDVPTPDEIRRVFAELGVELPPNTTDGDLEEIRALALEAPDPYADRSAA